MRTLFVVLMFFAILLAARPVAQLLAQSPSPVDSSATAEAAEGNNGANGATPPAEPEAPSFFQIVFSGGWIGTVIVLTLVALSITAAALTIEHAMTIREKVLIPDGLSERVREQLGGGNLVAADQICQTKPSLLSFVLRAGFAEVDGGWSAVEKALEDATAEQAARLFRKIEFLSVIGNIAPMVGLLGTVTGMILAFQEVAASQGAARASELAEGIYQALVTTVGGLVVAIPCLAAFAIFRNRVDQLVAEAAYQVQHAVAPLKRGRSRQPATRGTPVPPSPPQTGAKPG